MYKNKQLSTFTAKPMKYARTSSARVTDLFRALLIRSTILKRDFVWHTKRRSDSVFETVYTQ